MRILVEQSGYHLKNMGDLAMLQVAISRLSSFWPDATIKVFVTEPQSLIEHCPNTQPLSPSGRSLWFSPLIQSVYKLKPRKLVTQYWSKMEWTLRNYSPSFVKSLFEFKLRNRPEELKDFKTFMEAIYNADLVVATGGGYITDTFPDSASDALDTLRLAIRLGKPAIMLGQGLGPLQKPELLTKAKAVLPSVDLIALRERRAGVPLLKSIGVSQERIIVTGDDAIELAYRNRNAELGDGIGVNLRVSEYSGINLSLVETVRSALHHAAKKRGTRLIPAPISRLYEEGYEESDSRSIEKLIKGYDDTSDGGQYLDTPLKVIKQIGHCRVMVTGSYHAGVFALAQGIPVVGLAKSEYYVDKFLGLADQFGAGCQVILLNDQQLKEKLVGSINNAWEASEQLRPQLLEAAKRQVDIGHTAYKRVYELVQSR